MKKLISILLLLAMCVTMFAACKKEDAGLTEAADYLFALYSKDAKVTAADYNVVSAVKVGDTTYTVEWSTNVDSIKVVPSDKPGMVTIDVFEKTQEVITYTLTATIKNAKGESIVKTFEREVPKYDVTTWDTYMAAKEGDTVRVEGIVVAINSKAAGNSRNHLFLMDESGVGGYYSYQMEADPVKDLGIELGMTVSVAGPCSPYSGMQEIKGGTATIIDKTIKTFDYIDITDKFVEGTDFNKLVALPVTVKGVTLGAQVLDVATSQYLYFELNGIKSYVRTYVTDFPTTLKAEDKATIDADHLAHFGWKADVSGIMITYSGIPYLIPTSVTPFTNYVEVIKTPAEKVEAEKEALKLDASYSSDAVIDLPTSGKYYGSDVTITWATSDETNAAIADGKLTLTIPNEAVEVTLTATITCGEATATKEIKIKLSKTITPIKDILEIGKDITADTAEKYIVAGVITEVKNDKYGNVYITDAAGTTLYIYGLYDAEGNRYDAIDAAKKPVVGDYIVVTSVIATYQGTPQLKNAVINTVVKPTTIPDANNIGKDLTSDTTEKYLVSGVIDEIKSDKYGNMYLKDAEGNKIYVYGTYSENGETRYDSLTVKPAVGDTVTVYGVLSIYKSEVQLKNAWIVVHTPKAAEGGDTETDAPAGDDNTGTTTPPAGDNTPAGTAPVAGKGYTISAANADGMLYFSGTVTNGRFDASTDASNAVTVYVEAGANAGEYLLYFMKDSAKTYIVMDDKATGGKLTTNKADATVFEWNTTYNTMEVADDENARAFGAQSTSTYKNFSPYAISNGNNGYNWGQFTEVAA
ncbi:MAG: hypothetical protein E7626_03295 [Ruminococcaceae bacterium]|nr:hypothetical protein [Oscillospiraceae bacterium]